MICLWLSEHEYSGVGGFALNTSQSSSNEQQIKCAERETTIKESNSTPFNTLKPAVAGCKASVSWFHNENI